MGLGVSREGVEGSVMREDSVGVPWNAPEARARWDGNTWREYPETMRKRCQQWMQLSSWSVFSDTPWVQVTTSRVRFCRILACAMSHCSLNFFHLDHF